MTKELKDIFPQAQCWRTVPEFLVWYEKGVQKLRLSVKELQKEVLLRTRDSEQNPTAKRLSEEISPLYNVLKRIPEFASCKVKSNWGNQPFDVEIKGHPLFDRIEIVSATENRDSADERKRMLEEPEVTMKCTALDIANIAPIVDKIEKTIERKKSKNYQGTYALIVSFNNETILCPPYEKEFEKQIRIKNIQLGIFKKIFITGETMEAEVLCLP